MSFKAHCSVHLLVLFICFASGNVAALPVFDSPRFNASYIIGSTISVSWTDHDSGATNATIILAFNGSNITVEEAALYSNGAFVLFALVPNNGAFNWTAPMALNDYAARNDYVFLLNGTSIVTSYRIKSAVFNLV